LSHDAGEQLGNLAALDAPTLNSADDLPQVFDNCATKVRMWRRSGPRRSSTGPPGVQGLLLPSPLVTVIVCGTATIGFLPCVVLPTAKGTADVAASTVARMGKDQNAAVGTPDRPAPQIRAQA